MRWPPQCCAEISYLDKAAHLLSVHANLYEQRDRPTCESSPPEFVADEALDLLRLLDVVEIVCTVAEYVSHCHRQTGLIRAGIIRFS
jgi:hypothetical protein